MIHCRFEEDPEDFSGEEGSEDEEDEDAEVEAEDDEDAEEDETGTLLLI